MSRLMSVIMRYLYSNRIIYIRLKLIQNAFHLDENELNTRMNENNTFSENISVLTFLLSSIS